MAADNAEIFVMLVDGVGVGDVELFSMEDTGLLWADDIACTVPEALLLTME